MRYLSAEDILVIHAFVIDETGGTHGVRDPHLLQSIVHKPQTEFGGKQLYANLFSKGAVLLEAIVNYHVFIDGNKRTALVCAARFLAINGYAFVAGNEDAEHTVLSVATKTMNIEQLAKWFKQNTRKLKT